MAIMQIPPPSSKIDPGTDRVGSSTLATLRITAIRVSDRLVYLVRGTRACGSSTLATSYVSLRRRRPLHDSGPLLTLYVLLSSEYNISISLMMCGFSKLDGWRK